MKRLFSLLLAIIVLFCQPLMVFAHDYVQPDKSDCSIEMLVRYEGENITGGTLTAVRVGYVQEDDGNYDFRQEITNELLEDITSSSLPKELTDFYSNNKNDHDFYTQTQSVTNGKATFRGLGVGLYLIIQNKAAEGYSKMNPFLVSVPYMEDGQYRYHVTASVKSELEREPETIPPSTKPPQYLPQTGQLNWPVPVLAVSGLAVFVLGWYLRFGRKKDGYEK